MKKLVYIMALLMGMSLMSCSNYGDNLVDVIEKTPAPTPTPKDTTKRDTIPTWKGDWGVPVKNNLIPVGEPTATSHMWNAIQVFYNGQGDSLVHRAEVPFGYELIPATGFSPAKTKKIAVYTSMSATSANSKNTTYGEWFEDAEKNTLRKVSNTFEIRTSEFNKTLAVSHYEGYSTVNGKNHSFKSPSISATFKSLTVTDSIELTRNDSIFMRRTYLMVGTARFYISNTNYKNYDVSATHVVESFLRLVEKKSEETMPPADIYVGKLLNATDVVASPRFTGSTGDVQVAQWHKTSLVEDETSYHIWVDGKFVGSMAKSELIGEGYNAAMLDKDGKTWVPCVCKPDGKEGWFYSFSLANGREEWQDVDERLCVNSGLKNLTKDDRANQTPFVKTIRESKTYNGKKWIKLTCYNVDNKPTFSYTVAEK